MKNTHEGVLLLVKLQIKAYDFTRSNSLQWVFITFFEYRNGTKLRKTSQMTLGSKRLFR